MLTIIEKSKISEHYAIGAANAITALVKAGVTFNGTDLRGIKIAGADISGGYFDSADLSRSDLSEVYLARCWLRNAQLMFCGVNDLSIGEFPYIEHGNHLCSIVYRPDINLLVSANQSSVNIWDITNFQFTLISKFNPLGETIECVHMSANAKVLVAGGSNGTVCIWQLGNDRDIKVKKVHSEGVLSLQLSEDGCILVSGSLDKTIRVWDVVNDDIKILYKGSVNCVCVSLDGRVVVSGSNDFVVRVFGPTKFRILNLRGHTEKINCVTLCNNRQIAASGSDDKTIRIWDLNKSCQIMVFEGHESSVDCIHFRSDGMLLVSGSHDLTVRIWNLENRISLIMRGHQFPIRSVDCSDMGTIASAGNGGKVRIWKEDAGYLEKSFTDTSGVMSVHMSGDGKKIISSRFNGTVKIREITSGKEVLISHECENSCNGGNVDEDCFISCVYLNENGQNLVFGSMDGTVKIRRLNSKKAIQLWKHEDSVGTITASKDSMVIVSGSDDGKVNVCDLRRQNKSVYSGHTDGVNCVHVTSDGEIVASGGADCTVHVWDVQTGKAVVLNGHKKNVMSVHLNADGSKVASGSDDLTIRVWDVQSGKSVSWECLGDDVFLSRDGLTVLATGRSLRTIWVWDVTSQSQVSFIELHSVITSLNVHEDSSQLVVGFLDSSIQIWKYFDNKGQNWQLVWSSNYFSLSLNVSQCNFSKSTGLSQQNELLFTQRGAILDNKEGSNTLRSSAVLLSSVGRRSGNPIHQLTEEVEGAMDDIEHKHE